MNITGRMNMIGENRRKKMNNKEYNAQLFLDIKQFAADWITKVVSKQKKYQNRLLQVLDELIPSDLTDEDLQNGVGNGFLPQTRFTSYDNALMDYMTEIEYEHDFICLSKKGYNDLCCALRIAGDIYTEPQGGVMGYCVGDLKKVINDGNAEQINKNFILSNIMNSPNNTLIYL
jgi:hypothetical protein